jgi:hypothetical protein
MLAAYSKNDPKFGWIHVPVRFPEAKGEPAQRKYSGLALAGLNEPPIA